MRRFALIALLVPAAACYEAGPDKLHLDDVLTPAADDELALIDRSAALDGARNPELADIGDALDFADAPAGFYLDFDGAAVTDDMDEVPPPATVYDNFLAGAAAVVWADAVTLAVVGPPVIGIGVAANGTVTEIEKNVWYAENTITLGSEELTTHFTVAWVGVGWLAEMRLSSSDGRLDETLWFNGFLAYTGALGWWDIYNEGGDLVGVVEWIADGKGNAEFGMAATHGEHAGSALGYLFADDGSALVSAWDESAAEQSWVYAANDGSGEVRLPGYNGGEAACWATDLTNTACPE